VAAHRVDGARLPVVDTHDLVAADVSEGNVAEAAAALAVRGAADAVRGALVFATDRPGRGVLVADPAAATLGRRARRAERQARRAATRVQFRVAKLVAALLVRCTFGPIGVARRGAAVVRRIAHLRAALERVDAGLPGVLADETAAVLLRAHR